METIAPRRSEAEQPAGSASTTARAWRWGVWHRDDRAWLATLEERNARLLPRLREQHALTVADAAPPRVIHQIWLGPHPIPESCRAWMQTWKTLHPAWEYVRVCACVHA